MSLTERLPYYPRSNLIEQVWKVYDSGLENAVTLFAPRRQGKTMFVKNELLPSAQTRRLETCYLDLWQRRDQPELALTEGLEIAAAEKHPRTWRLTAVEGSLGAGLARVKAIGEPHRREAEGVIENRLRAALEALIPRSGGLLLVLDEFQALAGTANESFVAALRAVIQEHSDRLRVFYTGSSRHALNTMFRRQRAPLFASAYGMNLPPLGEDFVSDRAAFLERRIGAPVNVEAMSDVFRRLRNTPAFLNSVVLNILVSDNPDVYVAYKQWLDAQRAQGASDFIGELRDLDIAILRIITDSARPPIFGKSSVAAISKQVGRRITTGQIQTAIERLSKNHVIAPTGEAGGYEVDDPALHVYLYEILGDGN